MTKPGSYSMYSGCSRSRSGVDGVDGSLRTLLALESIDLCEGILLLPRFGPLIAPFDRSSQTVFPRPFDPALMTQSLASDSFATSASNLTVAKWANTFPLIHCYRSRFPLPRRGCRALSGFAEVPSFIHFDRGSRIWPHKTVYGLFGQSHASAQSVN
jgi:hypothetical protein